MRPADIVLEILMREADDTGEVTLSGPQLRELVGQRGKDWDLQSIVLGLKESGHFRQFYSEGFGDGWNFSLSMYL